MKSAWQFSYLLLSGLHVLSQLAWPHLALWTKPVLIPLLLLFYLSAATAGTRNLLVIAALLFSFAGDVLLMRNDQEIFFLLGLASFLGAHVAYMFVYAAMRGPENERMLRGVQKLRYSFPVLLTGFGLLGILVPNAGTMKIPVTAYALVLMSMVLAALFRFGRTSTSSFVMVFGGAILFMISDSLLAINKFMDPIPLGSFWIMLTYCAAQYLIVRGLIEHARRS